MYYMYNKQNSNYFKNIIILIEIIKGVIKGSLKCSLLSSSMVNVRYTSLVTG